MVERARQIVVIGAGVGGLACAIDLAAHGERVLLIERQSTPGGKIRVLSAGPHKVDAGPTVLTMRWVFEDLFASAKTSLEREVHLERATILARHAWADGTRLDLFADRRASSDAIGAAFGAREARAFDAFADDAARIYSIVETPFLRSQRPTVLGLAKQARTMGFGAFARIDAFHSMWSSLENRFADPRLRQLFGRYATYCGSSPFDAPATLNLVAHVESEGVYRVRGGMQSLASALAKVASDLGVESVYGCNVERIEVRDGRASAVHAGGRTYEAEAVVFNGDVSAVADGLLGRGAARGATATARDDRSLSALTWAMSARTSNFPLVHHNVFFSKNYEAEFASLRSGRPPTEPTVYVCAQDRGDQETVLAEERLLLVVNAPASGDDPARWSTAEIERCERATTQALEQSGLTLDVTAKVVTSPVDFHRLFPATGGALYGPVARGAFSMLSRQAARSKVDGLFFAGGSVHPGPGVPMAALSGRLAADRVREDLARTRTRRTERVTTANDP